MGPGLLEVSVRDSDGKTGVGSFPADDAAPRWPRMTAAGHMLRWGRSDQAAWGAINPHLFLSRGHH